MEQSQQEYGKENHAIGRFYPSICHTWLLGGASRGCKGCWKRRQVLDEVPLCTNADLMDIGEEWRWYGTAGSIRPGLRFQTWLHDSSRCHRLPFFEYFSSSKVCAFHFLLPQVRIWIIVHLSLHRTHECPAKRQI